MKSFTTFIAEAMATCEHPTIKNKCLHDFLFHLSGPSDPTMHSDALKEGIDDVMFYMVTEDVDVEKVAHKSMNLPKTRAMIDLGNAETPKGTNLHKTMGHKLRETFTKMDSESPEEAKAGVKASKAHWNGFAQSRGLKTGPSMLGENGKTMKSSGEGVHTKGLSLAPHASSGLHNFDVCPRASKECRANCLGTEAGGNKQYPDVALSAKVLRTHYVAQHPEHAARLIDHEIGLHAKSASKKGYKPGVRLNVTSDISWEHHAPQLFKRHPNVQFYDYTKIHNRVGHSKNPENYHLSLSHTGTGHAESNDKHVVQKLEAGHTVAAVYHRGKDVPEPTHFEDVKSGRRYPIVNGDHDDNTFDRHAQAGRTEGQAGHGVVSGLKLKGVKNGAAGHFANPVDKDGIIRINSGS
jgi:hypothetical protein